MDYADFDLDSLSALVTARGDRAPDASAENASGDLPSLPAQRRLWFMDRLLPGACLFNLPFCVRIEGSLDPDRFAAAVKRVMHRQPALRSVFAESGDDVAIRIADRADPPLEIERRDEDRLSAKALADLAERYGRTAFDLETGPLFRLRLVLCGTDRAYLFATFHHICFDGWSIGVFFNDLRDAYGGRLDKVPADDDIAGHLQRVHRDTPDSSGLAYWKARLAQVPPLRLPTDRERPAEQNHDGAVVSLRLPPALSRHIDELATAEDASPFMVLLAAWQLLLSRHAGQDRFAIGVPVSGRDSRPGLEALVGMFVNTLPLLADLGGNPSWRSFLARVRAHVLEAFGHKDTPFDSMVAALDAARDPSMHPVHQAGFILQNQAGGQASLSEDLALFPESIAPVASQLDVELQVWPEEDGYRCDLIYCPRLFDGGRMERLLSHYRNLLAALAAQPDLPISEYAFLDADEIAAHRALLRPAAADSAGLLARLETTMRDHGDAIAIEDGDGCWTYRELRSAAESVAAAIESQGIAPGDPVALFMPPSRRQVAAILGVLLSGGAWVGLDSRYPSRFLARTLADCRARVLLVEGTPPPFAQDTADLVAIDTGALRVADRTSYSWAERDRAGDRAYIIYTSGSTGEPKGVIGTRRGILNRHDWMCRVLPPRPDDVFCYKTTLGFVDSVQEILSPLLAGGRLAIAAQEVAADASLLLAFLARHRVSRLTLVPSLLAALLDLADDWREQLARLRLVISSGEVLPTDTARRLLAAAPDCRLLNIYGSSEVAADVTAHRVGPADLAAGPVPIGRPIDGCRLFVVDEALQPVPFGRPGELLVGGHCLAEGYWKRPALTESRFYAMPEADGGPSRVFATGDLVSLREDGCLLYHGRRDWQVKIRGQRVDLDGVQACLEADNGVRRGVVLTIAPSGSTDPILVALVEGTADGSVLRARLSEELAAATVPSFIWPIDAIPLLPNGKADRRAAADLALRLFDKAAETESARELTATERRIAAVWAEFLPIGTLGPDSDFFSLGGHSLLAVRVAKRLSQDFGTIVSLRMLMRATTLNELAEALDAQAAGDHGKDYPLFEIRRRSSAAAPVLSRTQQRLMFLESKSGGDGGLYHFPIEFVLPAGCSAADVEAALRAVVARHDVFRLGRDEAPPVPLDVQTADEKHFATLLRDNAHRSFDLEAESAIRALLLTPARGGPSVLAVVMHHVVTDAWSMGIFATDLRQALAASIAGDDVPAPARHPVRWADYVASMESWLDGEVGRRHLEHWTASLRDLPPPISWPEAFVASPSDHRARDWSCEIGQDRVAALKRHTAAKATTSFAVVCAALNLALHRLTGADAVLVGTATANRDHPECGDMMGVFANTLPVLTRPDRPDSAADWLTATGAALKDALAWPWLPLDRLVNALGAGEVRRPSELFQVFCNQLPTAETSGDHDIEVRQTVRLGCEFDLMLFFQADDTDALSLHWRCREAVFPRAFPERFTALYLDCLDLILKRKRAEEVAPSTDPRNECGGLRSALAALPSVADVHVARRLDAAGQIRLVAFVVPNGLPKLSLWRESLNQVDGGLAERVTFAPLERLPRDDRGNLALEALADCPAWDEATLSAVTASCRRQVDAAVGDPELLRPRPNARPLIHRWELGLSAEAGDAAATASPAAPVSSSAPPSVVAGPPLAFPDDFPATLPGHFARAAQGDGALIQIDGAGGERRLSYARLRQRAGSVLTALRRRGMTPGDRLFLLTGNPIDFFTGFWACLQGGLIACPFPAPKSTAADDGDLQRMVQIGKRLGVAAVLFPEGPDRPDPAASQGLGFDKPWFAIPDLVAEQAEPASEHEAAPDDVALLLFTSGSTGLPKAVMLSHANILAMAEGLRQRHGFDEHDGILNWMPLEHVGVIGMLSPVALVTGASQVHVETAHVLADPLRWLDLLDRYKTAHTWAPHFAFALIGDLAEQARGRDWDLSRVKCLLNGGEAVIAGGLARFLAVASPYGLDRAAIAPSWGMSETSSSFLLRQGVDPEVLAADPYAIVDVGTPHPGGEARLVGEDGRPVPLGEEGRLEVRGPQVNLGYWGDTEATAASRDGEGWFRTGDRARFETAGREPTGLVITGRDKEVIVINGQNYSQQVLESALEELEDITTTCVAAVGVPDRQDGAERLAVFFHSPQRGQARARQGLAAMRDKLRRGFGLLPDYVIPLAEDEFPKTAIGKIQRKVLRQGFIDRRYDKRVIDIDKLEANARTLPLRLDRVSWMPVSDRAEPTNDRDGDGEKALSARMPTVLFPRAPADILALAEAGPRHALVITRAAFAVVGDDTPDPTQAACLALARDLAQERDDIALRLLDLGAEDDAARAIRRETAALLQGETCRNRPFQAERAGRLYRQALFPHARKTLDAPSPLRRNGRYLVSGGTGAVGQAVVGWLLRRWAGQVVVVGQRSDPMETAGWKDLRTLAATKPGAALSYLAADDPLLQEKIREIMGASGPDWLFHLGGLYRHALLDRLDADDLAEQLSVKVGLLSKLAACMTPGEDKRIVAFSSAMTLLGAVGSAAYAAANLAMEAEVVRLSRQGHRAMALQWPAWTSHGRGVGMSANHDDAIAAQGQLGLSSMDGARALDMLEVAVRLPAGVHALGLSEEGQRLSSMMVLERPAPYRMVLPVPSPDVDRVLSLPTAIAGQCATVRIRSAGERRGSGLRTAKSARLERHVRDCWAEILGVEIPPSPDSSFFELGGNSIRLFRMHALLQDRSGLSFPQVQLFRHTTIAELTEFLTDLAETEPRDGDSPSAPRKSAAGSRAALRRSARQRANRESQP